MPVRLSQLPFTRLLSAVLVANFLTLAVTNLLELPVYSAVFVLAGTTVGGLHLFSRLSLRPRRAWAGHLDKVAIVTGALTLILLTVPRLVYGLQWLPGAEVRVVGDDYARLAELASMTLSSHYPLRHPSNADYLLSFYYTTLYPLAALKLAVPVLTLKDVLILGNFFYHLLLVGSVVEISHVFFGRAGQVRWFVFLLTLFSGLDWLAKPLALTSTYEWWQKDFFAGNTQISSFFTGMYWVIHHYLAFYALVLAGVWLFYSYVRRQGGRNQWQKPLAVALLAASAFYSSPFSVLSLPFFAVLHWRLLWRHVVRTWMFAYVTVLAAIPLFIFVGRLPESTLVRSTFRLQVTGDFWLDKLISLPLYVLLVPLVEFAGLPFVLLFLWRRMSTLDRRYYGAASLYFLLTYLVAFAGLNNLAMRGMFLPSFVFCFLFAKYSPWLAATSWRSDLQEVRPPGSRTARKWLPTAALALFVVVTSLGAFKMAGAMLQVGWLNTSVPYDQAGKPRPQELTYPYRNLVFDRTVDTYLPTAGDRKGRTKYNTEKLIEGITIEEMAPWERELLRSLRQGLY